MSWQGVIYARKQSLKTILVSPIGTQRRADRVLNLLSKNDPSMNILLKNLTILRLIDNRRS